MTCFRSLVIRICFITLYLYLYMPVSMPTCETAYCTASASWYASALLSLYWTWRSTIILVILMISLNRWKACPNLECFLSLVVRVFTGFRLKLKSRWR